MEVLKSLLLLWCFQEVIQCNEIKPYCADQVEAVRVKAGDTVTIPCRISYPKDWDENTTVSVYWREATSIPCGNARYIYNHTDKSTDEKYKGRLSIVGSQHKETSLRIQGLMTTDGPRFCCRVELKNKEREEKWNNRHTTVLRFQDNREIYVEQLDAVPAIQGENIIIPCRIHNLPANKQELKEVIWRLGNSELCTDNKELITERQRRNSNSKYSVVDFPNDVSLHIKDVRPTDNKHYCCEVLVGFERVRSTHGTQLGVKDSRSHTEYFVHQPQKASATKGGSVTIPCSFNSTNNNDPLWVGIYWRVGSLTGPYTYQPSQEFISSTYMGRTQLMGQGHLHIQGLQEADSTSYYCIVMLRFCNGTNKYDSVVAHGQGTTLNVEGPENNTGLNTITIIIICLVVLIIATVIFGILIFLRKKGKICKTESNTNTVYATADMPMRTQPSTTNNSSHEMQPNSSAHEESGGVLYADLKIKPGNKINVERLEDNDPQVLYSAVKPKMHHN